MDCQEGTSKDLRQPVAGYEAPCVERVLNPTELEREILYAGTTPSPGVDG